jgi:thiol-disulfide isomerase/thioredoxin
VCLCADWCGTCREYRVIFDALARSHPHVRFEWVDIEDEAELAGDLDVEIFPNLLIADGASVRFLGALLPQVHVLARLLSTLQAGQARQTAGPTHKSFSSASARHASAEGAGKASPMRPKAVTSRGSASVHLALQR